MATTQLTPALDSSESVTRYTTISLMNRDWDVLCRDLRAADRVAEWAEEHKVLAGAASPRDIVEKISDLHRRGDLDSHDGVMRLLVERAGGGGFDGHLAWRIAVRILLPKAVLMAKTQRRTGLPWDDVCAAVFGAAYEVVRTYPLERRPRHIFNNLALDTLQLARRTLAACFDESRKSRTSPAASPRSPRPNATPGTPTSSPARTRKPPTTRSNSRTC
ncbi:hypothetical protein ABZ669_38300 [Streptomyces hirsutus]|uniref:hypothetical protein n=1 Tax=Streptomyces hirsutus TaxID=35620 RepID=UPI0033D92464